VVLKKESTGMFRSVTNNNSTRNPRVSGPGGGGVIQEATNVHGFEINTASMFQKKSAQFDSQSCVGNSSLLVNSTRIKRPDAKNHIKVDYNKSLNMNPVTLAELGGSKVSVHSPMLYMSYKTPIINNRKKKQKKTTIFSCLLCELYYR
jgi:hypothetical protein